jgi:hypothetical protein
MAKLAASECSSRTLTKVATRLTSKFIGKCSLQLAGYEGLAHQEIQVILNGL